MEDMPRPRVEGEACEDPSLTCYMKQTRKPNIPVFRLSIVTP